MQIVFLFYFSVSLFNFCGTQNVFSFILIIYERFIMQLAINTMPLLKHQQMDQLHLEFVNIYNSVNKASKNDYRNKLIELLSHSKVHFAQEEQEMEDLGYRSMKEHKEEHKRIIEEMEYFIRLSVNAFGLNMLVSYYKQKLPYWFETHLRYMDSDLALAAQQKIVMAS